MGGRWRSERSPGRWDAEMRNADCGMRNGGAPGTPGVEPAPMRTTNGEEFIADCGMLSSRHRIRVRRGFSLVEMMIAVVILGLGLVMVATLFPVAIEQNRVAVQQSTVPAVARHALQTLRTRLQTVTGTSTNEDLDSSDFPGDRPHSSASEVNTGLPSVSQPVQSSSYHQNPAEPPPPPDPKATGEAPLSQPRAFRQIRGANMRRPPEPNDENNIYYYSSTRPDGILADLATEYIINIGIPSAFRFGAAFALLADRGQRSTPHDGTAENGAPGTYPKIDILDRVYPPVNPSNPKYPLDNAPGNDFPRWRDLREAAERRYFWTAFCAPAFGQVGPGGREMDVRIAVTFRENPAARYATQDTNGANRHVEPRALDDETDTIFPQAWLVKFQDDDGSTPIHANYTDAPIHILDRYLVAGEVRCHELVGRLLPEGAIFIDFERGKAHRVLRNTLLPNSQRYRRLLVTPETDLVLPSTLQTAYENGQTAFTPMEFHYPDFPDYAWVFPPAVQRTGGGAGAWPDGVNFAGKCPVLDVIEGKIPRQ